MQLIRLSEGGTLELSQAQLAEAGLAVGDLLVTSVVDGEVRVRSAKAVLQALQVDAAVVFAGSGVTVDGFIAERRKADAASS